MGNVKEEDVITNARIDYATIVSMKLACYDFAVR